MAGDAPPPSPQPRGGATSITDLNVDSLANCASFLSLQDVLNMSMSCKYLQTTSYSDSVWNSFFRQQWPLIPLELTPNSSAREAYLSRLDNVQKIKFCDPTVAEFTTGSNPHKNLMLDKNSIIFSQGSLIKVLRIDPNGKDSLVRLRGHSARISCIRLFPIDETPFHRNGDQRNDNLLVTSSLDHSIRIWWKDRRLRCLNGHDGPVCTLSDALFGGCTRKLIASGGFDGSVRIWSLESDGIRGEHALMATLRLHDEPVVLMSVPRHRTSHFVSISKNSWVLFVWCFLSPTMVMVWDATISSGFHSFGYVAKTTVPGAPVGMKCHESLIYVAAGSCVVGIDLRTMHKVLTLKHEEDIHSFQMLPLNSLICTGLTSRAMLWDIRKCGDIQRGEEVAELSGHIGRVNFLHMDRYKIVTGGSEDLNLNVWETKTGKQTNSVRHHVDNGQAISGMAVNGSRIVTTCNNQVHGHLQLLDYNNATSPVEFDDEGRVDSKFWGPQSYTDTKESDDDQKEY